jgi:Glycosyltransferase family 20
VIWAGGSRERQAASADSRPLPRRRPPVHYLHQTYPADEMAALYLAADVMLVTSLRDGMKDTIVRAGTVPPAEAGRRMRAVRMLDRVQAGLVAGSPLIRELDREPCSQYSGQCSSEANVVHANCIFSLAARPSGPARGYEGERHDGHDNLGLVR